MGARPAVERFTGRADVYDRYRPSYPPAILRPLEARYDFTTSRAVADVGSGTGRLTEIFLAHGNTVYAVEPNADMRARAEAGLSGHPRFHSVEGTAEATHLPDSSVNVVAAGQAFHWFDPALAREEFRRILRPSGFVVLVWNVRDESAAPFLGAYELFLREYSAGYAEVSHRRLTEGEGLAEFFSGGYLLDTFANPRSLDFESVWGGYRSASYSLPPGHPRHEEARGRLRVLFDQHQAGGVVSMPLRTVVYHGRI